MSNVVLDRLIGLVDDISGILSGHGITARIDFDHRDGIVIIRYRIHNSSPETTCYVDCNNMQAGGIDESKLWLPDYTASQAINREIRRRLEQDGYEVT